MNTYNLMKLNLFININDPNMKKKLLSPILASIVLGFFILCGHNGFFTVEKVTTLSQ